MSLILSVAVLAFVAYDFVLLTRMRKALNEAIEAMSELEAKLRAKPIKVGVEVPVGLKVDAAEVLRDLTNRIATAQRVEPDSEKSGSPRPGSPPCAN